MVKQILTMKRSVVLLFMMMICCLSIQAQKINVKGHVVDGSGEELIPQFGIIISA